MIYINKDRLPSFSKAFNNSFAIGKVNDGHHFIPKTWKRTQRASFNGSFNESYEKENR